MLRWIAPVAVLVCGSLLAPSPAGAAPTIHLKLRAVTPGLTFYARPVTPAATAHTEPPAAFRRLCLDNCELDVPDAIYQLALSAEDGPVLLAKDAEVDRNAELQGSYRSLERTRLIGWGMMGGGAAVGVATVAYMIAKHGLHPLSFGGIVLTVGLTLPGFAVSRQPDVATVDVLPR